MINGTALDAADATSNGQGKAEQGDRVGIARTTGSHPERAVAMNYVTSEPALRADVWIYRMVVAALGLVLVFATIGGIMIGMSGGGQVPEVVIALGTGAVGALGGLLAPSPSSRQ